MEDLGTVESTLFVPMLGRIYASENFPDILYDKAALSFKDKLPNSLFLNDKQSQYTYIASASRSANMDRFIRDFINRKPSGVIVQLGCGLETTFNRNDNGHTKWYGVDLANVIDYRKTLIPESPREKYLSGDAFSDEWIRKVREDNGDAPILITASGLFYYFEEDKVISLLKMLLNFGDIEVVFDAVNRKGMQMMRKKWMKKVGHEDAKMFFYVDSANALAKTVGEKAKVLAEDKYYKNIKKKGLKLATKISMGFSDLFKMVKMIHLSL